MVRSPPRKMLPIAESSRKGRRSDEGSYHCTLPHLRVTGRVPRESVTVAVYPLSQEVGIRLPDRIARWRLAPMFAAQELDARRSGLPVYWEGAARTEGGRGYLELTGYDRALVM